MPTENQKARAGRPKGAKGKRTVATMVEASHRIMEIRRAGQKKAVEILNDLMQTSMSFAATYQRKIMLEDGRTMNPEAARDDIDLFWKAMECTGIFAKSLAPFQDPVFKAIVVMPSAPPLPEPKTVEGKVVRLNDPVALSRVYQQMVKRIG